MRKVLVANRGEIAVRAFRAATELGIGTVAVYAWEDRNAVHRTKADEAYEIGEKGHPVRAYLDIDGLIEVAKRSGADAIYPGYGFLSENPALADACDAAGITFVGPTGKVLRLTGSKVAALKAAREAGIPVLRSSGRIEPPASADDTAELDAAAQQVGFPLFIKALAGGGGRGMRRVESAGQLHELYQSASREAEAAFGDGAVFLEEAITRPRHIEVQILADGDGNVVHLFERDCSVQRRHQKVVEMAPAPGLDAALRDQLCESAVALARSIGYRNAGTAEFLVDPVTGRYVFIEMNPRIQVEHTVTEETTDVDLVQSQLRIAGGATLAELGIEQDTVQQRGAAIQCRITTEDPERDFRPDTGRIAVYRTPGGAGIRLDGGTAYAGAEVSPFFDSMLVKLTCRGRDHASAAERARRALAEFRIRGVTTNIGFLRAVLAEPELLDGKATTAFIDEHPHLVRGTRTADSATRIATFLADRTVNKPHGDAPTRLSAPTKLPTVDQSVAPPDGSRQRLLELGPKRFAEEIRAAEQVYVTDTTFRDAHQSLLATRIRSTDLLAAAPVMARTLPQLFSLEAWGGATYDVALRFLAEDPWHRLLQLREAAPNLCLQMLLRGRNTVGYTPYPDEVCQAFVKEAHATGVDVFRIFDALNDVGQMAPAIHAGLECGTAFVEGTLCYTGDLSSPDERLYTLDYYLRLAEQLVDEGVHALCIKDMAGLLRAPAATTLVTALRERFDLPVHLHTHDTAGGQLATYLAAIGAGVDMIDGAQGPLSGMTSQPPLGAIVAATDHGPRETGLSLDALADLEPYWEAVRRLYKPFEIGLDAPTGAVYRHEIPGGQLSNLRAQAIAVGLGEKFEEIEHAYAAVDRILGHIVKVTPTSKVVGDLALAMVANGISAEQLEQDPASVDLPASVIGFLHGELGTPPGGWPEPFRTKALEGRDWSPKDAELAPEWSAALAGDDAKQRRHALNHLLFPGPTEDYVTHRDTYGDTATVPTDLFWYGMETGTESQVRLREGVLVYLALESIGEPDDRGIRSVGVRVNGQVRPLDVRDRSVKVSQPSNEKADKAKPGHVGAPYHGVATVTVAEGDHVEVGQPVASIEAMKMESAVSAPVAGTVERVLLTSSGDVEAQDLLLVITPD